MTKRNTGRTLNRQRSQALRIVVLLVAAAPWTYFVLTRRTPWWETLIGIIPAFVVIIAALGLFISSRRIEAVERELQVVSEVNDGPGSVNSNGEASRGVELIDGQPPAAQRRQRKPESGIYILVLIGILAALAVVVGALLVAVGMTFISGTEVLEAVIYTVSYSAIIAGVYIVASRSRTGSAESEVTTETRLAAAKASALLASEKQQVRLEGALQLEALARIAPDFLSPAARALQDLVPGPDKEVSTSLRYIARSAIEALSRLNPLLRAQGLALDLRYCLLSEQNLSGLDLRGADLTGADLRKTLLIGSDLTGATLNGATLDHADLTNVDLAYATLLNASLKHALLFGVHFEGTYLSPQREGLL